MAIVEYIGPRVTPKYLENKYTKAELAREYLNLLNELEKLRDDLKKAQQKEMFREPSRD